MDWNCVVIKSLKTYNTEEYLIILIDPCDLGGYHPNFYCKFDSNSVCYTFTAKPLHLFLQNLACKYLNFWERI